MSLFGNEAPAGKTPSLQFQTPGTTHQGTIERISDPIQAKVYGTDEPATWKSGNPKMQVCITLKTGQVHPDTEKYPEHDGTWGLWVLNDFGFFLGSMLDAVQSAVAAAGADDIEVGGHLAVEFYGTDPDSKNPQNPRKLYRATYKAPAPKAGGGMFAGAAGNTDSVRPEEHDEGAPTPSNAGDPKPHGVPDDKVATVEMMLEAGVTPEKISTGTGVPVEAIKALQAQQPPF